jgi:hypothetical protein
MRNSPTTFNVPLLVILAAARSVPPELMLKARAAAFVKSLLNWTVLPLAIDQLILVGVSVPAVFEKVTRDEPPPKLTVAIEAEFDELNVPPV